LGAAAIAAASILGLTPAAHASAAPFPAGTTTIHGSGTLTLPVATNIAFPFTVTFVGTSDGAGHLAFAKSAISIPPISTSFELGGGPIPATIDISATTNWAGTINTTTGVMTLAGNIKVVVDFAGNSCTIGPLTGGGLHLSTETSGGQGFAPAGHDSTATVVDRTFEIPGVVVDPSGPCPLAALINDGAGLPIPPGTQAHSIVIVATIPPPVAPTTTTTTTATTTSTTTPIRATASELPKTGSPAVPLSLVGVVALAAGAGVLVLRRRPARR
jgi:LPXTG-motif cell wall-anchored protein